MNGIDRIVARISAEAQAEADKVLAEAQEECGKIEKAAEQTQQDEYWKIVKAGTLAAESKLSIIESSVALEVKKQELALKQELVQAAFERACELICAMPENDYIDLFAQLAAKSAYTGQEQIIMNAQDASRVGSRVCEKANALLKAESRPAALTLSCEHRAIAGGIILKNGNIETNCSVHSLTGQYKNALAVEVASLLFEQGGM